VEEGLEMGRLVLVLGGEYEVTMECTYDSVVDVFTVNRTNPAASVEVPGHGGGK
jgi:hypothetical protein